MNSTVKHMFREACYVKWYKSWVPVLILSPYDCPNVRVKNIMSRKLNTVQKSTKDKSKSSGNEVAEKTSISVEVTINSNVYTVSKRKLSLIRLRYIYSH